MAKIDVSERLSVLENEVKNWIENTESYRKQKDECSRMLFSKIEKIMEKVADLPCKERNNRYDSIGASIKTIWTVIVILIGAIAAGHIWK